MKKIGRHLTFANVIACMALFVALGGAGYAAFKLPKNSVGAAQLKKSAVTPAKLAPATKSTLTGPAGPIGKTGSTGPQGPQGFPGPAGDGKLYVSTGGALQISSEVPVASLSLPAGNYLIQSRMNVVHNGNTGSTRLECGMSDSSEALDFIKIRLQKNETTESVIFADAPMFAWVSLAAPDTVKIRCTSTFASVIELSERKLTALTVSSID